VFGFAGFYSKDAIIASTWASGSESGGIAFAVTVFAALLTSFYSWRLIFLTFFGKPRWSASEHIQHAAHGDHTAHAHDDGTAGYHPHESPWTMLLPLLLLATGAVFAGYVFHTQFLNPEAGHLFWQGSLAFDPELMEHVETAPLWVKLSASVVMLIGLFIAWLAYIKDTTIPARFTAMFGGLYQFLLNKWYWDELYDVLFVRPAQWLGRLFWKQGDQGTIDRFGPNGAALLVARSSALAARVQTGYLYSYALVMLMGLAAAATWAMTR
jgi:NADH-quinone oxidoreductase subunit L